MISSRGTGIFANNCSDAVKHEYSAALTVCATNEEAEDTLLNYFLDKINDSEEYTQADIWLPLAYCEWKRGRLSERVKNKALEIINNRSLDYAYDFREGRKRKKELKKLEEMITSPQPEAKPVRKNSGIRCPYRT